MLAQGVCRGIGLWWRHATRFISRRESERAVLSQIFSRTYTRQCIGRNRLSIADPRSVHPQNGFAVGRARIDRWPHLRLCFRIPGIHGRRDAAAFVSDHLALHLCSECRIHFGRNNSFSERASSAMSATKREQTVEVIAIIVII